MNRATRITVAIFGILFGISGMSHGFFETLQGNTPTDGLLISAIGEAHRMWVHGSEGAFTVIPNFLITGILAMTVGLVIVIWSVGFVHKRHGPLVFLLLFILLFLVGGGVAQVVFFALAWAVATRINSPLTWWRRVLPESLRGVLARLWVWFLIAGALSGILALQIAITGYVPGVNDSDVSLAIMLVCIGGMLLLLPLSAVAGFAYDIQKGGRVR